MREATDSSNNVAGLRAVIMLTIAAYVRGRDDAKDSQVLGALAACFCDALIINGTPLNDEVIESIRKTYELCQTQQAMEEKEDATVQ